MKFCCSDEDDDGAEAFAEAIDVPLTADETLRLAENWTRRYSTDGNRQNGSNDKDRGKLDPIGDEDDEPESGSYEYEDESDDFSYQEYDSEGKLTKSKQLCFHLCLLGVFLTCDVHSR